MNKGRLCNENNSTAPVVTVTVFNKKCWCSGLSNYLFQLVLFKRLLQNVKDGSISQLTICWLLVQHQLCFCLVLLCKFRLQTIQQQKSNHYKVEQEQASQKKNHLLQVKSVWGSIKGCSVALWMNRSDIIISDKEAIVLRNTQRCTCSNTYTYKNKLHILMSYIFLCLIYCSTLTRSIITQYF